MQKTLFRRVPGPRRNSSALSVFRRLGTQGIYENGLDGGGRFIPADIVGVHTLHLLLPSRVAHDRATEDNHTQQSLLYSLSLIHTRSETWAEYINLDREVSNPSPYE